jgi:hypothetical protein
VSAVLIVGLIVVGLFVAYCVIVLAFAAITFRSCRRAEREMDERFRAMRGRLR